MADEFDVLIKNLEVLEKIINVRPNRDDDKQRQSAIMVVKKIQLVGEKIMGDKFENVTNSSIINRSLISNAWNNVASEYGDEIKAALEEISKYIEQSGNEESVELLNGLSKELINENPNKTILKAIWDGLVGSLPDAAKVATAITTISKLFT